MMTKLKQKADLIRLISKIHYIETVPYITVEKYISDYIANTPNSYISDNFLYNINSNLALFKLNFEPHNDSCISLTITDPEKNILAMVESNNKSHLDRILAGAEAVMEAIKAYKNYIQQQNEILEKQNDGKWVSLDLQQSEYHITKQEIEQFKNIMKKMCTAQDIDFEKLKNINFKFSFRAWSPLGNNDNDDDLEWI